MNPISSGAPENPNCISKKPNTAAAISVYTSNMELLMLYTPIQAKTIIAGYRMPYGTASIFTQTLINGMLRTRRSRFPIQKLATSPQNTQDGMVAALPRKASKCQHEWCIGH